MTNHFLLFLGRSAYTEDNFKDYNESSYPWRRQKAPCAVHKISHVVCETELIADNASFQNDVNGIQIRSHGDIQSDCSVDGSGTTTVTTPVNAVESCQDYVTYTQSQCGNMDNDNSNIAVRDTFDMLGNAERAEPQQNDDKDFETGIKSQTVTRLYDDALNNTELAGQESSCPHVVTISNTTQQNDTLLVAHQPQDQADQNNIDLINSLDAMAVQGGAGSVCPQGGCDTCTPLSSCLFNGLAEGVGATEDITYKLTATDVKIVEDSFRSKQGNSNFQVQTEVVDQTHFQSMRFKTSVVPRIV